MRIANTVNDSIVDGHGLRFTIFTQGCPHHCPGCHNPDTHDPAGGREVSLEELMAEMGRNPLIEGVTLSGGEPFAQAADCAALAQAAHARGLNVWTYSGYLFEHLRDSGNPDWTALLALSGLPHVLGILPQHSLLGHRLRQHSIRRIGIKTKHQKTLLVPLHL